MASGKRQSAPPRRERPIDAAVAAAPGWVFLLVGLALAGAMVLLPAYGELREAAWQRDLMRLQAQRLAEQEERYREFEAALERDDPTLLRRLAYAQLRLRPVDREPLRAGRGGGGGGGRGGGGGAGVVRPDVAGVAGYPAGLVSGEDERVEAWLSRPLPEVGVDLEPLAPLNTRLVRMSRGWYRLVVLAAAVLCVVAGLWPAGAGGAEGD